MGRFTGALNLVKDKKLPIAATIAGGAALGTSEESEAGFYGELAEKADLFMLGIAKKMEAAGKNARAIQEKTNWVKGVDDKWRFELSDYDQGFASPNVISELQRWERHGPSREYKDEITTYPEELGLTNLLDNYPQLQKPPYLTIKIKPGNMDTRGASFHPKNNIIEVSPGTVELRVEKDVNGNSTYKTLPRDRDNVIQDVRDMVLHEVQHTIQGIEDFAQGGSQTYSDKFARAVLEKEGEQLRPTFAKIAKESATRPNSYLYEADLIFDMENIGQPRSLFGSDMWYKYGDKVTELLGPPPKYGSRLPYAQEAGKTIGAILRKNASWNTLELLDQGRDEVKRVLKNQQAKNKRAFNKISWDERKAVDAFQKRKEQYDLLRNNPTQYERQYGSLPYGKWSEDTANLENYRKLAGEVEARNVQTRRDLTPDQLRNKSYTDTEDVPRKLQIAYTLDPSNSIEAARNLNFKASGSADPKLLGALAGGSSLAAGGLLMSNDEASKSKTPKVDFLSKEEKQAIADKLKLRETGEIMALDYPSLYNLGRTLNKFDTPFGNPIGGVADLLEHLGTGGIDSKSRYSETGIPRYDLTGKKGLWAALDFL